MTKPKMFRFGSIDPNIEFFIEQDVRLPLLSYFDDGSTINCPGFRQEGIGRSGDP
jgi:hypothetical protein